MSPLAHLVSPLNHVLFIIGADHVTVAELAGFITGAACVWLTVKVDIANFPVGLANDAFFLFLFLAAGLYADSALQIVYLVLGVVGWWQWLHGGANHTRLEARHSSGGELLVLGTLIVTITWGLTLLLGAVHDIAPFWDALTTALSLAAQWLLNTKKIENWYFWIAADVVYVPLYGVKHLWLTGLVYLIFLAMCFRGLTEWRQALVPAKQVPASSFVPGLEVAD
jgi:nicotinamide mononucleotide transporter